VALAARGLAFRYRERQVLSGVDFQVQAAEIFGFLGPNGAGKSTLFSILAGLLPPLEGTFEAGGAPVAPRDPGLRARTGVVFQSPSIDGKLSCEENLLLAAALFRVPRAEARARTARLLSEAGLADRVREPAERLSGGLRRRLELARAQVHRPALLLLDEPTSGLDAAAFARTWEVIEGLRRAEGLTVLLTTHRPEEAERCDRLAVLSRGRIVACETPAALRGRVAGDLLELEADDPEALAAGLRARFGLEPRVTARGVEVVRERGHELVPRIVEAFPPGRFRSVAVRRPTLADAFLRLTGAPLSEDEA
jgi:ABC-2 type transport system ATP-binding protein